MADTIILDRYAFVEKLQTRGFSRDQAQGIAEAVSDIALSQLVTKGDLNATAADLRLDMQRVKNELLKFSFAAMAAQTALIVALLELLR